MKRRTGSTGRRIQRGCGARGDDIYQWEPPSEARKVDDERKGREVCKVCGAEVLVVEGPLGVWSKRDLETHFVHAMSCSPEV